MKTTIHCLLDGNRGIYIPQSFAKFFNAHEWNIKAEDTEALLFGPEHKHYWEAWDDVCNYATHTDKEGNTWTLYQDDSLFCVNQDHNFDED